MPVPRSVGRVLSYVLLACFFAVSFAARPLLPIDETRYLTVSWEMILRQNFLVPTLNFEPYFQKPPLLFWLIDLAWGLLGVGRAAALCVIFVISASVIHLTKRLAEAFFPSRADIAERVPWLVLGSAMFCIYSSLILFDLLLTAFVIAAMLALVKFSRDGGFRYAALAGVFVGLGVLTKGPVVLIHVAPAIAFYTLWRVPGSSVPARRFFAGMPLLFLAGLLPVAAWLGPALYETGFDFAYRLVWLQAAGRVSGSLNSAHARPFYFYALLLPVALLPWGVLPEFWRSKPWLRFRLGDGIAAQDQRTLRFLFFWCLSVFLVFSLISGKQPHYLVPLLPPLILLFAYATATIRFALFPTTAAFMLVLFGIGQIVASGTALARYDLSGLAGYMAARRDAEWAFAGRYQGQLGFLARLRKPLDVIDDKAANAWLESHPRGFVIMRAQDVSDRDRRVVLNQLGRNDRLIVLGAPDL